MNTDMPNRKNVKWGEMKAGESHLSDEWHDMDAGHSKENWDDLTPSKARMSEKWVDMENPSDDGKWFEMKQEGREDPYAMFPNSGDRKQPFKPMKKETPDNKVERKTQHSELGSTREI